MLTGSDCSRGEGGDTVVHPSGFVRRAITIQRRGRYVTEMESLGEGNRVGQWATTFDRLRYTPQRVRGPFQPVTFVPRTNYRQPCLPRVNRASAKSAREILDRGSKDWKNWEGNRR